jgi:hypothetical protein
MRRVVCRECKSSAEPESIATSESSSDRESLSELESFELWESDSAAVVRLRSYPTITVTMSRAYSECHSSVSLNNVVMSMGVRRECAGSRERVVIEGSSKISPIRNVHATGSLE